MDDLSRPPAAQRAHELVEQTRALIARSKSSLQETQRLLEVSGRLLVGSTSPPPHRPRRQA